MYLKVCYNDRLHQFAYDGEKTEVCNIGIVPMNLNNIGDYTGEVKEERDQ